jgi:AraC-like DNA-binding protein
VVIEIDGSKPNRQLDKLNDFPFRLDALSIILICKGQLNVEIDYYPYKLSENTLLDIVEQHIVQNFHFSPDFKGYSIIVSRDFLSESLGNNRTLPSDVIASKRTRPAQSLKEEEVVLLEGHIKRLIYYIGQSDNYFQRSLIMSQFLILMMEIGNINLHKTEGGQSLKISRKEQVVSRFLELLSLHSKEMHEVTFYAKELCITPEYLSRILKTFSGKTVNKWISNALMTESKILLRTPDLSIQQIADILHFADQSSFGKFFKKHHGLSPLEYRKKKSVINSSKDFPL